MFPECSWKTLPIHTTLWKTNDLRAQGASRSGEALEVQTGPPKPLTGRWKAGMGSLACELGLFNRRDGRG